MLRPIATGIAAILLGLGIFYFSWWEIDPQKMLSAASSQMAMMPGQVADGQADMVAAAQEQFASMGKMSFVIKLNKGTVCAMGACQSVEIDKMSRFGLTWFLGIFVFFGLIWITWAGLQGDYSPPFLVGIMGGSVLLLLMTWYTASSEPEILQLFGVQRGNGPLATAAGAILGIVGVIVFRRGADATSAMGGMPYVPQVIPPRPAMTPAQPSATSPQAPRTTMPPGAAASSSFAAARGATSTSLPPPMLDLDLPGAASGTHALAFALRAEATIARISPKGIQAKVNPNDAIVAIAWGELQELRVWALPETVEGGRVFAEFIGALGATIRLTIATDLQFRDVQVPEGSFDTKLAFIARVILSQKPGFIIDDQTLYFMRGEAPPPRFANLAAFREHDKALT
ncbi:MAG: hypothetical protein IPL79_10315 [Myxococcales bacterium]|nr:hypothetical protein [Myxococcales bacterium]